MMIYDELKINEVILQYNSFQLKILVSFINEQSILDCSIFPQS